VPGTFPLKYRIPPLWLQGLFFFSGGFTVSLLWRESFFELPIRGLLYEMATTKPCQMISKHGELKHDFRKHFKKTQLKRTISRHMIRRDFEVFFAVKHTSGITGDPVKVLQQSMTPKKGVYIMRTLLLINLHILFDGSKSQKP